MPLRGQILEKVLISNLKSGEHHAFTSIFTAYYRDLVLFAGRFTHDLSSAEEIVQNVFVDLWEDRELLKINVSLKSYLIKTVQNRCIDWYRHKKLEKAHDNYVKTNGNLIYCNTEEYLLRSELEDKIETGLGALPSEVSQVFRMNRYNGLKYHEIAEMLGVSVRTVEVRISKALQLLRVHLRDYLSGIALLLWLFLKI